LFGLTFDRAFAHDGVRVSGRGLLKLRRVRVSRRPDRCDEWTRDSY
jgi:hypothetical protein